MSKPASERWRNYRDAFQVVPRWRRLWQLRRCEHVLHRRLANGYLRCAALQIPGRACFTNKPPCGPKRGHGTPQPRYALEVQLDKIAEQLKLDPAEIRRQHLVKPLLVNGELSTHRQHGSWQVYRQSCRRFRLEEQIFRLGSNERKLPYGKGIGIACSSYICGAGLPIYWNNMPQSGVQLRLDRQGGVCVMCGSTDIGQGSDSILAYIVAEVLGIDPFDIRVVTADTDLTPVDLGSYSSRVTLMTGNAAIQAAERARELLVMAVAEKLGAPIENLSLAERRVFDVENPEVGVSFAEAVVLAESKFGTIGTVGSYSPPAHRASLKARASGRLRPIAIQRQLPKSMLILTPASSLSNASGLRTTSANRSIRCS